MRAWLCLAVLAPASPPQPPRLQPGIEVLARNAPQEPESLSVPIFSGTSPVIEAGAVTPSIGATYPLDQVPEAMRHLDAGKARGKIAIAI